MKLEIILLAILGITYSGIIKRPTLSSMPLGSRTSETIPVPTCISTERIIQAKNEAEAVSSAVALNAGGNGDATAVSCSQSQNENRYKQESYEDKMRERKLFGTKDWGLFN